MKPSVVATIVPRSPPPWPPYQTRAYQQKAMEQIEETQAAFKEDLDQVKGDVSSMKGDLSQVLLALKNIIDRLDQIPRVAFEEVAKPLVHQAVTNQGRNQRKD